MGIPGYLPPRRSVLAGVVVRLRLLHRECRGAGNDVAAAGLGAPKGRTTLVTRGSAGANGDASPSVVHGCRAENGHPQWNRQSTMLRC